MFEFRAFGVGYGDGRVYFHKHVAVPRLEEIARFDPQQRLWSDSRAPHESWHGCSEMLLAPDREQVLARFGTEKALVFEPCRPNRGCLGRDGVMKIPANRFR
jgi:hypothetical protein